MNTTHAAQLSYYQLITSAAEEALSRQGGSISEISTQVAAERDLPKGEVFSRCLYLCDNGGAMERAERAFWC